MTQRDFHPRPFTAEVAMILARRAIRQAQESSSRAVRAPPVAPSPPPKPPPTV